MHYKNGREAKQGDMVVSLGAVGVPKVGMVHSLNAGSDTCNGRLAHVTDGDPWVTIGECLHVDDINYTPPTPPQP